MQKNPVNFQEVIKLTALAVDPKSFKFGVTTFESDKYISIKDLSTGGEGQLTIIEPTNNFKMSRKPNKAEAALMHPAQNIIALKAKSESAGGHVVQIWNMDTKQKLKNVEFPEPVIFWKWANLSKLAVVTATVVFMMDINNPNEDQAKVMDRAGPIADPSVQIIGYGLEPNQKWCALWGITTPDGGKTINGHIQLYLIEGAKQQLLEGHCCCFGEAMIHTDNHKSTLFCFVERKAGELSSRVHMTEITPPPEGFAKHKKVSEITYSPDVPSDFPVFMHVSTKYGVLYIMSKFGHLFLYELTTGALLFRQQISAPQDSVFIGSKNSITDGILVISKSGSLISAALDEKGYISHLVTQCSYAIPDVSTVALKLAARYSLPGCDNLFVDLFNNMLISGNYQGAAKIASQAPGTLLRNPDTINKFKNLQSQPGQPQPILIYFQTLLEKGRLNVFESIELVKPVLANNRKNFIENWLTQDKLECSEELGDLVKPYDIQLAIVIYKKANSTQKLTQAYMETGQLDLAMNVSAQAGIRPDYISMLKTLVVTNPEAALTTAKNLCQKDASIPVHSIAEIFLQNNKLQEMTGFLVECMVANRPEDGPWQTKVLELNLMHAPQVADAILQMEKWNQFNKQKIAMLCEQKGMFQRALENYADLKDIRRVVLNTHAIPVDWLVNYLGKMQSEWMLTCIGDLLRHNRGNLQLCVQVTAANYQKLDLQTCLKIFEGVGSFDGIYYFLGSIINNTNDKDIYYKYIEAAAKCSQMKEVERVIREKTDCYDPVKVKDFLKEIKLPDPKPLIFLCDIHGFVDELTKYLFKNNFTKYIEIYLFKVNPNATSTVLGTLIDLECDENYMKQILYTIRGNCPIEQLIEEFDKRNKLRVLENWLDSRVAEGNVLPPVHNALAKIKIDTNQDPQSFLINNQYYDSLVVGKYCEERDPHLAYTAYKRAWGNCDMELIEVTNKNSLYRLQARYLVERQSKELWNTVLSPDNPHRKAIIEQVVSAALPDSKNVDEVSCAVQAFLAAELHVDLISLLEKIVLHNSEFGQYKKLQNLLIITAIKTDKGRVMDYINRLDNYDGPDIAKIALGEQYQLYEEAFVIYKKSGYVVEAIEVLLNNIESIPRAAEFAEKTNQPEVWSKLAHCYLEKFLVNESIDCYMKANDCSTYPNVINAAENEGLYEILIKYLLMARQAVKDVLIDNTIIYCYAKTDKLNELENFISNSNSADIQRVGDKCYDEKLYEAARILFTSIKNNARIASCLVRLKQFQKAIDAAKKANTPRTWKELCMACVEAQEYKLAAVAGMNIIIHPDHLEDLIAHYEEHEVADEMISLLQNGMTLERAHIGIFTELGILYAKYQPEKLMEHIKIYFSKLNVSKLLRACERYLLWSEAVYLYSHYDEFDNSVQIMIEHSPSAWNHDLFVNLIQKVANHDLYYKAILFYLEEMPMMLNDLLKGLTNKIDLTKTVTVMKKTGYLPLIVPWLKSVQTLNNQAVNEALNEIYLESEDHESLRTSVQQYENFEPLSLCKATETHELIEFRRVAAYLYRKIGKYDLSINLSKLDKVYRDAIETAQESGKPELVEELLRFFVAKGEKEMFTCCLYTCYDFIRPNIALELSWRFSLFDYSMPYFIQIVKELTTKVEVVQKKHEDREKKEEKQAQQQMNQPLDVVTDFLMPGFNNPMLMAGPSQVPMNNMMGGFMGSQMGGMPGMPGMGGFMG